MYVHRVNNGKRIAQFTCGNYSKIPVGKLCSTQHRVNADDVIALIKDTLKATVDFARFDREVFVQTVNEIGCKRENNEVAKQKSNLEILERRVITSYSIHYTKLYDRACPLQRRFRHKS